MKRKSIQSTIFLRTVYVTMIVTLCTSAFGAAPKYSNEFLSLGVGARQMAMGGSSIATSSVVYSTYWNPTGLTELKSAM